jgi:phosphate acyltransferase
MLKKRESSMAVTLAVDCMGGDRGPEVIFNACRIFLSQHPTASLLLLGQEVALAKFHHDRVQKIVATEVVTMDDTIEVALRKKKNSSMRLAIEQVKNGRAQVAVSCGNTGALMAISRYLLKTIDGVDRPAIASQIPNIKSGSTTVLDLGANVDCEADHLLQFAVMGSALVSVLQDKREPKVGLLNIGGEVIKGNEIIKKTNKILCQAANTGAINFYGNVEGNDIFTGIVDIVVCDGFVGNVALKSSEGLVRMMGGIIKEEFSRSLVTKIAALFSSRVLSNIKKRVDHRHYNGAALLGLRGLVFKSHGSADEVGFTAALEKAHDAVQNNLLSRLQERMAQVSSILTTQEINQESVNDADCVIAAKGD